MAVSDRPWGSFSESDYTPEQFCRAALIDLNPSGEPKTKGLCKLPVREPDGTLNRNGVHAAAAVLAGARGGVDAPPDQKRAAARRLRAAYGELDEPVPDALARLAG
jgi:hypothetical protein